MRILQLLISLAMTAALLLCAAATAFAQTTPPPGGDERPTLIVGPFELRPRIIVHSIGVDNNVFNEAENPKRDFTFGANPDVEATLRTGPVRIVWLTGSEFLWYQDYESERAVNRSSNVTVDATLKAFRPFVNYTAAVTSSRPSPEIDARAERRPRSLSAGATLKLATRTSVGFKWVNGRERFDEEAAFRGQGLAETLNNESETLEGTVGLELTPLTSFSIVVGRDELRFDHSPFRNSTSARVAPTLTFSPAGVINGSASVGYKTFEGVDSRLPDYKGLAMNGSVAVILAQRFRVETRFTRDVQYSYEEFLPYYVLTGGRATVATQLTNLLDFRLAAGHDRMHYRAYEGGESPGTDRLRVYGGGVGFRVGDQKRLVIQAEFIQRTSTRDHIREFKNHRIFGTLTWGA